MKNIKNKLIVITQVFWGAGHLIFSDLLCTYLLATQCFILACHVNLLYITFTRISVSRKKILIVFLYLYFLGQKICLFPNGSLSWWWIVDHSPRQRYANKEYIFCDYILVSRKNDFLFQVILMISLQDFTWLVLSAP